MKWPISIAAIILFCAGAAFGSDTPVYIEISDAPTIIVDWARGSTQAVVLHGNRTIVFENGEKGHRYTLILKQDDVGARTVVWPDAIHWPGASKTAIPTLTTTADRKDYVGFFCDGAIYDALAISQDF